MQLPPRTRRKDIPVLRPEPSGGSDNRITYDGRHYTGYEATQTQRKIERAMRTQKRRILTDEATGDNEKLQRDQIKLQRLRQEYKRFSSAAGLRTQNERAQAAGFGRGQAARAATQVKKVEREANALFSSGSAKANVSAYLKEKPVIDMLAAQGVKYKWRISAKEIIVDAGKPDITGMRVHAVQNLKNKADRAGMTPERAQSFVDAAKLTLYQQDRQNLKFLAQDGYVILNLGHEMVTAVPQKWRKKYDQYLWRGDL